MRTDEAIKGVPAVIPGQVYLSETTKLWGVVSVSGGYAVVRRLGRPACAVCWIPDSAAEEHRWPVASLLLPGMKLRWAATWSCWYCERRSTGGPLAIVGTPLDPVFEGCLFCSDECINNQIEDYENHGQD